MDITIDLSNVKNMYETTIVVTPEAGDSDYKKVVEKFESMIKENDGEIINLELWGSRKLAYPIAKHTHAYYAFVEFKAPGRLIGKMEQEFIYDTKVIRYLTVKLDKNAVAYNIKRREKGFGQAKEDKK